MEITLTTVIDAVTVYTGQAMVTRSGAWICEEAGEHTLLVTGLPNGLQQTSLRATGRGPAGMRILGIEQGPEFHDAPPEEALRTLRNAIMRLAGEITLVDARVKALEEQRGWLSSLGEHTARSVAFGIQRGTAKAEDAGSVFAYAAAESRRLAEEKLAQERRRVELQQELEARNREYRELGGAKQPDRVVARVRLATPAAGRVELTLSYTINGATWAPRYDARVEIDAARVRLTRQALVSQRTGEDWSNVALALSTAQPHAAVTLPDEPDPWYLDILKPTPPPAPQAMVMAGAPRFARVASAPAASTDSFMKASDADGDVAFGAATPAIEEAAFASAMAERSGVAQVFRIAGGSNVPSDGAPHTLGLGDADLPCQLEYVVAPALAAGAQLRARATNTTGQVLLPGSLHVFHAGSAGDEYIGATQLERTAEHDDLTLYLGADANVTVKRELVERDTDKGSLLQSGVRRITFGYRIAVSNRTSAALRVVVKDRLPLPRHERIKVRVLDVRPQPSARTKLEQVTWEMQLQPNEERRVEWRFVVEAPAELDLIGLPA